LTPTAKRRTGALPRNDANQLWRLFDDRPGAFKDINQVIRVDVLDKKQPIEGAKVLDCEVHWLMCRRARPGWLCQINRRLTVSGPFWPSADRDALAFG
jgi:hypothetical protein